VDRFAPRDCLMQLGLLAGEGDRILSVGPPPCAAELTASVEGVHAPLGSARLCGRRIAGLVGEAEVIHAWSPAALTAALGAARLRCLPVVYSLPHLPRAGELGRLVELSAAGMLTLTVPTEASREALLRAGAAAAGVCVLPPAAAGIPNRDELRYRTRELLGLAESDFLLVAPGEMARDAGHMHAAWAQAMVRHVRGDLKLLLPGTGQALRAVEFFSARTGFGDEVLFVEDGLGLGESLAAGDAAVFFHTRDSGVSALAAAMSAGLPIACSNTPDAAECTAAARAAILVPPGEPRAAGAAILELIENTALARRLAEAAKAIATSRFAPDTCRRSLRRIHDAAAGSPCAA